MTPGEKIRFARESRRQKMSQYALAELIDGNRSSVNAWEHGKNPVPLDMLGKIAEALEVPLSWFLDGLDSPIPGPVSPPPGVTPPAPRGVIEGAFRRKYPVLGSVGAAAIPLDSPDADPDSFVEFSDELYMRGRDDMFAVQVVGDSMAPRLLHGDFVLVVPDLNFRVSDRCVVVSNPDGCYLVKALKRVSAGWALNSINEEYPTISMSEPGWKMVGRVVGLRREKGRGRYLEEGDRTGLDAFG